jgi:maltose-binding protein MalE
MSQPHQTKKYLRLLRTAGTFSLLIVAGVLATGCSKKQPTATTTNQILVRIWRVDQSQDVLKAKMQQFMEKNKSQNVVVSYDQRKSETYELDALKSLAARLGPDIWSVKNDWIGDHTPRFTPLPDNYYYPKDSKGNKATTGTSPAEQVKNIYPAGISEQLIGTDGKSVYALPTAVDSLRMYVNMEMLSTAAQEYRKSLGDKARSEDYTPVQQLLSNPATTWLDLTEQAKYITRRNGNDIQRSAIALGTADNVRNAQDILQLLIMQNGAQIVSSDRRNALFHIPTTTSSGVSVRPGELALDFFTSFANPNKATYTWNASMPQNIDAFGQGKVAMIIGYSDIDAQLKIKYPKMNYKIAPVPQKSATEQAVNMLSFTVEGVTKTANNTGAAFAFLSTYTDLETTKNIASQAKLLSPYLSDLNNSATDPFVKKVLTGKAVFKRSRTQFNEIFSQIIRDVNQNGLPSSQALDAGAESINKLLQDESQL